MYNSCENITVPLLTSNPFFLFLPALMLPYCLLAAIHLNVDFMQLPRPTFRSLDAFLTPCIVKPQLVSPRDLVKDRPPVNAYLPRMYVQQYSKGTTILLRQNTTFCK